MGLYPPFPTEALASIHASEGKVIRNTDEGSVKTVKLLGFNDGVVVLPFDTPSYTPEEAPAVEYAVDIPDGAKSLEFRTLANLHVHEGRDARYAVSIDSSPAEIFSIHTEDFSAEWRWNVLRGYSSRSVDISALQPGRHKVTIHLLDPGIVLQEIRVK